jgi:hypothetical protein
MVLLKKAHKFILAIGFFMDFFKMNFSTILIESHKMKGFKSMYNNMYLQKIYLLF